MFIREYTVKNLYQRKSKTGALHQYYRHITIVILRCDSCGKEFERPRGSMNPRRLNNNFFHVCNYCDAKRFAQKKGIEKKQIWNLTASSSLPVSKH